MGRINSLRTKLVMVMVLLILALMVIVGAFLLSGVGRFYIGKFYTQMESTFSQEYIVQLQNVAGESAAPAAELKEMLMAQSNLGIDISSRNVYILDESGAVLDTSAKDLEITMTENLLTALSGGVGQNSSINNDYMDLAVPIQGENGTYIVVMTSDVTGLTTTFEFKVNTNAPEVSLVGCNNGETTLNDVTITGCKVGDRIKVYKITDKGEVLVEEIEVASLATKMPTITEGGEYRIVVESEAGVATELTFVRKHVMNTAGSVFIMVVIGLAVVGLFTGLIYRNKSKTDD